MFITLKNMYRYLRFSKKLFALAILSLVIMQILLLVSPLIIKNIIDNNLNSVTGTYELLKSDESVLINNKYYTKNDTTTEGVMVIEGNNGYYLIDNIISTSEYNITKNGVTSDVAQVRKLEANEIRQLYQNSFEALKILIFLLFLRVLFSTIFSYIQRVCNNLIIIDMVERARLDAVQNIHILPISYIDNEPTGKLSARITHDVAGIMNTYTIMMTLVFGATLNLLFAFIGMFYLDSRLALVTFILFPIIYFWLRFFTSSIHQIASRVAENNSKIISKINEVINSITILKIFNYEKSTLDQFQVINDDFLKDQLKEMRFHLTFGWNLIILFRGFVIVALLYYFGYNSLHVSGVIVTAGMIYAYVDYVERMLGPLELLFRESGNFQHAIVRTNRFFKLIDINDEDTLLHEKDRYQGEIELTNVNFAYPEDKDNQILKNINLKIKAGQMIGLVGHTGSGKSTLLNLLMRFYDIEDNNGSITIDGQSIYATNRRTYRQHLGIILQEPILFTGTLADNIRFGSDVSDEYVTEVLCMLGGRRIIEKLEHGIHQPITRKGDNLSLGEKQIIAFARAMVKNPSVLILDEATANLDTETEQMIQSALQTLAKNRTIIVIAHRLSTIMDADMIVVLESGEIIEKGKHVDLIKNNRVYASMFRSLTSQ